MCKIKEKKSFSPRQLALLASFLTSLKSCITLNKDHWRKKIWRNWDRARCFHGCSTQQREALSDYSQDMKRTVRLVASVAERKKERMEPSFFRLPFRAMRSSGRVSEQMASFLQWNFHTSFLSLSLFSCLIAVCHCERRREREDLIILLQLRGSVYFLSLESVIQCATQRQVGLRLPLSTLIECYRSPISRVL